MSTEQATKQDPRQMEGKPSGPEAPQPAVGIEAQMRQQPDYGLESYRGYGRLQGKAALITGGDSGIGRAVALAFAREGADMLISYYNEEQDAQEAVFLASTESSYITGEVIGVTGGMPLP